jgi:hypothetical protein
MEIGLIRLLIDFGFMVLIWAVQLVIYPSFQFYNPENLFRWHRLYTRRVTVIVLPLMLSQLMLSIIQILVEINLYTVISLIIIISLWLLTFLIFVPLHQRIDRAEASDQPCRELVRLNWMRTALWTSLFLWSLFHLF